MQDVVNHQASNIREFQKVRAKSDEILESRQEFKLNLYEKYIVDFSKLP